MKVHELPFNDTIKADFELIMRRVLSKFPAAKIYTIPDADLAEIQVYVIISGVSKEGVESVDLSDVKTSYWIAAEHILDDGLYIEAWEMNDVTINDTGSVEVKL